MLFHIAALIGLIVILGGSLTFIGVFGSRVSDRSGLTDGFTQLVLETPSPVGVGINLQTMTLKPHIAGSENNRQVGEKMKQIFSEYGLPVTWTESYPVELSYPQSHQVLVTNGTSTYEAVLFEKVVNDGTEDPQDVVPTYHGYSPSGFAEGELVYVNYGSAGDYAYIDGLGISLKGKIVIARYGHGFRGDKCALAEHRGAIGCLIYSDPSDDGYLKGPVYPEGPWRPDDGVQRGSVWSGSGDPTTPGWPSTPISPRLNLTEASDPNTPGLTWPLLTIPTQPISYGDAKHFLEKLQGAPAPPNMSGSTEWLTGGYFIGPGPAVVTMNISNQFEVRTIQNHFGKIPGDVEPDRIVMLGVHHDAWTYGGADPMSGSVAMLEVVRSFGKMYKNGWRPRRSIIFASWDAEEYATVGSSEFCELHFQDLTNRLVAYLNLDIAVSGTGTFSAAGTPNFVQLLKNVTKMVDSPVPKTSVYEYWRRSGVDATDGPVLGSLGSGSDYSAFLQHVGISSLSIEFVPGDFSTYPEYHSRYDTFYFMSKFVDPDWTYHTTIAKTLGLVAKSLADSFIIPYNFVDYAHYLRLGLDNLRLELSAKNSQINFSDAYNACDAFMAAAQAALQLGWKLDKSRNPDPFQLRALNDRLFLTERAFLNYAGLPGQPWLRHMIYAPGRTDSYSAAMFPTVVNAASGHHPNWAEVQNQIQFISLYINAAADVLSGGNGQL